MSIKSKLKASIVRHPKLRVVAKKIKSKIEKNRTAPNSLTSIDYSTWIKTVETGVWSPIINSTKKRPLISILVPAYNTPDKYLIPLIESIKNQTYSNWELCIADASSDPERRSAIETIAKSDSKIHYSYESHKHISENTNNAFKLASGEYIGLLDHDDTLSPYAIQEVTNTIISNSNPVDIIYSDEDKLSDDGKVRTLPFFKPDWSPELLNGVNYITHFLVVKTDLFEKVGGLRKKYDGAQDYDLLLRITELTASIIHIPKILYHWRLADGSTAKTVDEKSYADSAGKLALEDMVGRRGIKANVLEIEDKPTNYRLQYIIDEPAPKVSIIIPFKDKAELLKTCVGSILRKTTYSNYEIILLSNNSDEQATKDLLVEYEIHDKISVFEWNHPFNYSKLNNFGVTKSHGEYIVLLNNDTEVITDTWLEEMVGVASQDGVGVVGPLLLYPDKKNGIQHAGVVLGMGTMAGHAFRYRQPGEWTDFGLSDWPRNYLALTAACFMVAKKLYNEVGGLDEVFTVAGNDVAFCLKVYEKGLRNVFWPFVRLYHYESVSVGTYNNGIELDYTHSLEYYQPYHKRGDQYFNTNLDLMNEQIGIGAK